MTPKEREKLWQWRDSWEAGDVDCYKNIGVQVFVAMMDDKHFRRLVMRQLRLPNGLTSQPPKARLRRRSAPALP
jgi:hypothetical protein